MVGNYPEDDVARASLEQLNEISRRAAAAGMSFANGGVANGNRPVTPNSASRILAAAAGMVQNPNQQPGAAQPQDQDQQAANQSQSQAQEQANASIANLSRQDALQRIEELARQRPSSAAGMQSGNAQQPPLPSVQYASGSEPFIMPGQESGALDLYNGGVGSVGDPTGLTHSGLQVFTLGHLMPKSMGDDSSATWNFDASRSGLGQQQQQASSSAQASAAYASTSTNGASSSMDGGSYDSSVNSGAVVRPTSAQKLRVRRSTFVPGWAVPPRVLLVDDDAVSRKLSSKFLQVFGCTIDVAVDGVVAVNKMNLEKYDLVLMVGIRSKEALRCR